MLNDVVIDNSLPTFKSDCENIQDYKGNNHINENLNLLSMSEIYFF